MGLRDWREQSIIRQQQLREKVAAFSAQGFSDKQISSLCKIPLAAVSRCKSASQAMGAIVSQQRRDRLAQENPPPAPNARAQVATDLRSKGYSYTEIAEHLDIPVSEVFPLIKDELARSLQCEIDDIDTARALSIARTDEALNAVMPGVFEGNARAIELMIKLEQHRAKLLGLDAPMRVDIEATLRKQAADLGLDPEDAVLAAMEIMKEARA